MNSLPHVRSHVEWRCQMSTEAKGLAAEIEKATEGNR